MVEKTAAVRLLKATEQHYYRGCSIYLALGKLNFKIFIHGLTTKETRSFINFA